MYKHFVEIIVIVLMPYCDTLRLYIYLGILPSTNTTYLIKYSTLFYIITYNNNVEYILFARDDK